MIRILSDLKFGELYSGMLNRISLFARKQPCLLCVLAILNSILPFLLLPEQKWAAGFSVPGFLIAAALLPSKDAFYKFALPGTLAALSVILTLQHIENDELKSLLKRPNAGVEARLEIVDTSCTGDTLCDLPVPKLIKCRVREIRFSARDEWKTVNAECMTAFGGQEELRPGYGDKYEVSGYFSMPDSAVEEGVFDYAEYLRQKGISYIFRVSETELISSGKGFHRRLLDLRGKILEKTLSNFHNEQTRGLAAGILFGFKQGISPKTKKDFIESGTIHILTVSGTHIGLFAAVLFLFFAFVPFRIRYLLVPFLTYFYALSTGMQEPAFRAFVMLLIFCLARAFLRSVSSFNSMMLAAALLLLINPVNILDPGFQYSFLTVAALLLSSDFISAWLSRISVDRSWIPSRFITFGTYFKYSIIRVFIGTLLTCSIAWLVSVSLSLMYQGVFASASVLANLILLPVAWLCFLCFGISVLFFWIPPLSAFASGILESLLSFMNNICGILAESASVHLPYAPLWTVFVFPILLFLLFRSRKTFSMLCIIVFMTGIMLYWHLRPLYMKPEILISWGGGSQEPAFVITSPKTRSATVVNVPDFETARDIMGFMNYRGIRRCPVLLATGARRDNCKGIPFLPLQYDVERLILPPPLSPLQTAAREAVESVSINGGEVLYYTRGSNYSYTFESWDLKTFAKKDFFRLESRTINSTVSIIFEKMEDGTATLLVSEMDSGKVIADLKLKNSFVKQNFRYFLSEASKNQ